MPSRIQISISILGALNISELQNFDPFVFLNSNKPNGKNLLALGAKKDTSHFDEGDQLGQLQNLHITDSDWLFGFMTYDLKNQLEVLKSENKPSFNLPILYFFQPKVVIEWCNESGIIHFYQEDYSEAEIRLLVSQLFKTQNNRVESVPEVTFHSNISKEAYLNQVEFLLNELRYGNIYEVNFCQQFQAIETTFDPFQGYVELNKISPVPFSAFLRKKDFFALCASPERYLSHKNGRMISQPIKGTIKRDPDVLVDAQLISDLQHSKKDKKENVMIVDLVRNDLSRTAKKGSVQVDELFGVHTYPQVHHLVSTISSELKPNLHPIEAIKTSFPMGSMTGAPKVSAMELIEQTENFKRQLYSGSIGYIKPNSDFDFNVVIRSLFFDHQTKQLSFAVGGAITSDSIPEKEYEESMLKAKAIFQMFGKT